jgi:hypothetical protein
VNIREATAAKLLRLIGFSREIYDAALNPFSGWNYHGDYIELRTVFRA